MTQRCADMGDLIWKIALFDTDFSDDWQACILNWDLLMSIIIIFLNYSRYEF